MAMPAHILMCPPDFYGIQYEINPVDGPPERVPTTIWRSGSGGTFGRVLEESGAERFLPSAGAGPSRPGVYRQCCVDLSAMWPIAARFRYTERQGEEPPRLNSGWRSTGSRFMPCPPRIFFEGAGDALFCGETLFAGYRYRSDIRGHQEIGDLLECRVISLDLAIRSSTTSTRAFARWPPE